VTDRRFTNDDHLREALGDALHPVRSPDFSRSIMGRLGYMRVSPTVARRKRTVLWVNRAAILMIAGVATVIGWRVFESSEQIRRPVELTLPQAISHDVQQQSERLDSMIQTIRQISTPRFAPTISASQRSTTEVTSPSQTHPPSSGSTIAPGAADGPMSADRVDPNPERYREPFSPSPIEHDEYPWGEVHMKLHGDDLNRVGFSPVRWA
jgi:hypothetical protein